MRPEIERVTAYGQNQCRRLSTSASRLRDIPTTHQRINEKRLIGPGRGAGTSATDSVRAVGDGSNKYQARDGFSHYDSSLRLHTATYLDLDLASVRSRGESYRLDLRLATALVTQDDD